jgi:hypothetical protein
MPILREDAKDAAEITQIRQRHHDRPAGPRGLHRGVVKAAL